MQERNTVKHFFELIYDSFDVKRGVLFTAKLLFTNPGKLINDYLDGRTKDYYNLLRYLPLHSSPYYSTYHDGRILPNADKFADTLIRLPLFYELPLEIVDMICQKIEDFFMDIMVQR